VVFYYLNCTEPPSGGFLMPRGNAMAKLSQLMQAYGDPRMRKMLDLIAYTEGVKHGYNTLFGNERFGNLGAHPNIKKAFRQTDGKTNYTTAAGRYQFLKGTYDDIANQYGLKDFSPRSQDLAAIALIDRRGALQDVLSGNYQSAIGKLGPEWASLPSSTYKQGKRSWGDVNKFLGSGIQQPEPKRQYVDLNTLREQKPLQRQYVNLDELRGQQIQPELKRQFVDLNALKNQEV
jgi:muramidase (phage lysozyme)